MARTVADFVEENREEIREAVERYLGHVPRQASCYCPLSGTEHTHVAAVERDDDELADWVANDEGLYRWALSEGVEVSKMTTANYKRSHLMNERKLALNGEALIKAAQLLEDGASLEDLLAAFPYHHHRNARCRSLALRAARQFRAFHGLTEAEYRTYRFWIQALPIEDAQSRAARAR